MKVKINPKQFSANSVPLVLDVLDHEGRSVGFAQYSQRIGDFAVYTFDGRQYKIDLTVFRSKRKTALTIA